MTGAENTSTPPLEQDPEALRLHSVLEPVVIAEDLFLEEVVVTGVGRTRTVQILVDLPEDELGSVSLDAISRISQSISTALDEDPGMGQEPYELEVSSPGVARPLSLPRHWKRNLGRLIKVNVAGSENFLGRLSEVSENGVTLVPRIEGKKGTKPKDGEPVSLNFDQIRHGKVEVEFSRVEEAEFADVADTEEA